MVKTVEKDKKQTTGNVKEEKPIVAIAQANFKENILETCQDANGKYLLKISKETGIAENFGSWKELEDKIIVPKNFNMPISTHLASGIEDYGSDRELFAEVRRFIHDRVDLNPEDELISSVFVFLTCVKEVLSNTPYIHVLGQYGSGKTTFFKTVGGICYNPITATGNSTIASIERIIHELRGTLLLDECDWDRFSSKLWYALLRSGYDRTQPYLKSVQVGRTWQTAEFDVFGAKLLVSYERFYDDALNSRCFEIVMHKKSRNLISVETADFMESAEIISLRNKLLLWKSKNLDRIQENYDSSLFNDLDVSERVKQMMRPLGNVVKLCLGIDSPEYQEILSVLHKLNGRELQRKSDSSEAKILRAIKGLLGNHTFNASTIKESNPSEFDKTSNQAIGMKLQKLGLDTWKKHNNAGNFYTVNEGFKGHLNRLLKEYGIESDNVNTVKTL